MRRFAGRFVMILIVSVTIPAQDVWPVGRHRVVLDTPGGPLPFGLLLDGVEGRLKAWVLNGPEKIEVPEVSWGKQIVLSFTHYDSKITLDVDEQNHRLTGVWEKRRSGKDTKMSLVTDDHRRRFRPRVASGKVAGWITGRWAVDFASSADPSVGVFKLAADRRTCTGTFLTTLGDYRYLAGVAFGDLVRLSCFDGAHAFLFHARRQPDGTLQGDFWSSNTWHEKWAAKRDSDAALPDGFKLTKWSANADLGKARFRDLDGKLRSLNDASFRGQARIIEVFGTWCPNCHDHGAYMADLHRRYGKKGLSVVGLAFEHTDDHARSVRQVRRFMKRHGGSFPVLVAGLSDKKKATAQLGLLDRVRSYPTTIFIGKDGTVRGVYQGFSGPASGPDHQRLKERFEALIERILAE
ncbi:MAG: hypothetical protein CMJ83_00845 [Planctomycetes bacterium]|nr:hypothetical protein [Planctomycetota bacterium]